MRWAFYLHDVAGVSQRLQIDQISISPVETRSGGECEVGITLRLAPYGVHRASVGSTGLGSAGCIGGRGSNDTRGNGYERGDDCGVHDTIVPNASGRGGCSGQEVCG
ncbi:hypothetical protein [Streptomyces sp. YKOK-I1]